MRQEHNKFITAKMNQSLEIHVRTGDAKALTFADLERWANQSDVEAMALKLDTGKKDKNAGAAAVQAGHNSSNNNNDSQNNNRQRRYNKNRRQQGQVNMADLDVFDEIFPSSFMFQIDGTHDETSHTSKSRTGRTSKRSRTPITPACSDASTVARPVSKYRKISGKPAFQEYQFTSEVPVPVVPRSRFPERKVNVVNVSAPLAHAQHLPNVQTPEEVREKAGPRASLQQVPARRHSMPSKRGKKKPQPNQIPPPPTLIQLVAQHSHQSHSRPPSSLSHPTVVTSEPESSHVDPMVARASAGPLQFSSGNELPSPALHKSDAGTVPLYLRQLPWQKPAVFAVPPEISHASSTHAAWTRGYTTGSFGRSSS
jgi:hypothetical protein